LIQKEETQKKLANLYGWALHSAAKKAHADRRPESTTVYTKRQKIRTKALRQIKTHCFRQSTLILL